MEDHANPSELLAGEEAAELQVADVGAPMDEVRKLKLHRDGSIWKWLLHGEEAFNSFAHATCPAVKEVIATAEGFFFIMFKTSVAMEEVTDDGPWLFQGQPIVLQK
ncbi:UNVERIFIED_CONTAM: hypothetical protein Sindi_2667600 [Sesamum indicum]